MTLTPLAVSARPLLAAIASGEHTTMQALANAAGRHANHMSRDIGALVTAGLAIREPKAMPKLTATGQMVLEELQGRGPPLASIPEGVVAQVPLDLIDNDPDLNPRTWFEDEPLDELTASIAERGVLQPILLRPAEEPGRYRVVAGERRWRAAKAAGLAAIPAMVRTLDDGAALEAATVENIQRQDLNPIEEARAFRRIVDFRVATGQSLREAKEEIAAVVKKTPRFVEQRLDLLELDDADQSRLLLTEGHPMALNLKTARFEIQAKRKRQKDREERTLTPAELLLVAEVVDAMDDRPSQPEGWWRGASCEVGAEALSDPLLQGLRARGVLEVVSGWRGDTVTRVTFGGRFQREHLEEQLPGFEDDRAAAVAGIRDQVIGHWPAHLQYFTAWLNEPFTPDPALVAQAEAAAQARAEREAQEAERQEEQQRAQERRQQELEQVRRDEGDYGRGFLAAVRAFEDEAPGLTPAEFTLAYRALWADHGAPGPFALHAHGARDNMLCDANGAPNVAAAAALEARRRLMVIAINYASGFAAYSGDDLDMPWSREPGEPGSQDDLEADEELEDEGVQ